MSLLSRLFGAKPEMPEDVQPETYDGFAIYPAPIKDGGQYRVAARIEKEIGGETKVHQLIRADTLQDPDAAREASVGKARQMIDEQGERLFD